MKPETIQKHYSRLSNNIIAREYQSKNHASKPITNPWEFLNNAFENICILIAVILCTPLGWIGLILLNLFMEK